MTYTRQEQIKELSSWEEIHNFSLVDMVKEWANCKEARVDEQGDVWVQDPQAGHLLSDDDLRKLIEWVNSHA